MFSVCRLTRRFGSAFFVDCLLFARTPSLYFRRRTAPSAPANIQRTEHEHRGCLHATNTLNLQLLHDHRLKSIRGHTLNAHIIIERSKTRWEEENNVLFVWHTTRVYRARESQTFAWLKRRTRMKHDLFRLKSPLNWIRWLATVTGGMPFASVTWAPRESRWRGSLTSPFPRRSAHSLRTERDERQSTLNRK